MFLKTALLSAASLSAPPNQTAPADELEIQKAIKAFYSTYFQERDKQKYRSLLTDDFTLLENGELMNADSVLAAMPKPEAPLKRADHFEFKSVTVHGDIAYAIYDLKSDITDKGKSRIAHWLESAILRKVQGRWLMCLLHSTRIPDHQKELR
jgi:ketosteroid isomerase-like protein